MSGTGRPGPDAGTPEAPQHKAAGAWVGYLIFALLLLFLIVMGAQAAYNHEWANVAGVTLFTAVLVLIPTGGLRWLRRFWRARKQPTRGDSDG